MRSFIEKVFLTGMAAALVVTVWAMFAIGQTGEGISQWPAQTDPVAADDLLGMTDVSDQTDSIDGSSKKLTVQQLDTRLTSRPITAAAGNNIIVKLGDDAGVQELIIQDSTGAEIASLNSNGTWDVKYMTFENQTNGGVWLDTGNAVNAVAGQNLNFVLGDAAGANQISILDSGDVEVASIDSDGNGTFGNLNASGTLAGNTRVNQKTVTGSITAGEMNGMIYVACAAECTLTLPAVTVGQSGCLRVTNTTQVHVDTQAADRIVLGTESGDVALDDGDKISSDTAASGSYVCLQGDSAAGWTTWGMRGTWTDGGP